MVDEQRRRVTEAFGGGYLGGVGGSNRRAEEYRKEARNVVQTLWKEGAQTVQLHDEQDTQALLFLISTRTWRAH